MTPTTQATPQSVTDMRPRSHSMTPTTRVMASGAVLMSHI